MRYGELKVWTDEWDGVPVVGAEGEIDLGTVDALRAAASEVVRGKPESIIFDLRKVTYIDSSGLGILLAARKQMGKNANAVVVVTGQASVIQSLKITGLDRVMRIQSELVEIPAAT